MTSCEVCGKKLGKGGRVEGCDLPIRFNKAVSNYGQMQKASEVVRAEKGELIWRLWYARLMQAKLAMMLGNVRALEKDMDKCWGGR